MIGNILSIFNQNEKSVARTIWVVVEKLRIDCVIKAHEMKTVTVDIFGRFLHLTRDKEMKTSAEICLVPFTRQLIPLLEFVDIPGGRASSLTSRCKEKS